MIKEKNIYDCIVNAIDGGVTIVQLREKNATSKEFYEVAKNLRIITKRKNVKLIINDRLDIALAVNADGVHLGQDDLPCDIARSTLGNNKIIGISVHNVKEAIIAKNNGADYVGVGAIFNTSTKTNTIKTSIDELKNIRKSINIPIIAIGGIKKDNIVHLKNTGINGIAVVSAIISSENIFKATQELKKEIYTAIFEKK